MKDIKTGQRWISEMEPELGLGIIKEIDRHIVKIHFPASECERLYALPSAPLKRVTFKTGDTIKSRNGESITVTGFIEQDDGIIVYFDEQTKIPENELSDSISFTTPQDRLINGFIDENQEFNLRAHALNFRYQSRQSEVRGFIGGRIDLIPHQIYVAHEVASRQIPRVLLSDEVGLGKTIEACLVIHRLLLSGKITRVLILVPQSLVHQWFIELLRRFNLIFRIYDDDYCESLEVADPDANIFLEDQLVLCNIDMLADEEQWQQQAVDASWDMVVIDEAHHLTGHSPGYALAERLSRVTTGLMLLTATPEQLGHRSHFARLQLLDPARYFDFDAFEREAAHYQQVAKIVNTLIDGKKLDANEIQLVKQLFAGEPVDSKQNPAERLVTDDKYKHQFIDDLLDRYGIGRAVFRNTRASMKGFPQRFVHIIPLDGTDADLEHQTQEFSSIIDDERDDITYHYNNDPRVLWLIKLLKTHKDKKILLICQSIDKVYAIEDALRQHVKINITLFHEDLTLLQRDRNAAWFARPDGAQVLICSEIGSEGRNFQFSHHLVLFDVPIDPELLEQRIGRLDRIGQTQDVHIHVPYIKNSEFEVLVRWYHEGLNAFEKNVPGVYQIFQKTGKQVIKLATHKQFSELDNFIRATQKEQQKLAAQLEKGRNRLLELHSFRTEVTERLIDEITRIDQKRVLEKFMLNLLNLYGIRAEEVSKRTYLLHLELLSDHEFPLPKHQQDALIITFDRKTGLSHEDIEFLSWDHPMVIGAMDLILGSEKGNCTVATLPDSSASEIMLEALYVLECIAPQKLQIDRFFPPTPVRVVVNHSQEDCSDLYPKELLAKQLRIFDNRDILENPEIKQQLFPMMLNKCREYAEIKGTEIRKTTQQKMEATLNREVHRLVELQKVNKFITEEEISLIRDEIKLLRKAIKGARLRLDSLRLIFKGEF